MKTLLVSGTPGTGKSFLARKLSLLLNYAYFDVNRHIKTARLYSSYDRKRQAFVVDENKLAMELLKVRNNAAKEGRRGIIFDSHLSHFLPSQWADLCIVACCQLKTLARRLQDRGYSVAKIRENIDAEIFQVCLSEAREQGHKLLVFDTTKASEASIKALAAKVRKLVRI